MYRFLTRRLAKKKELWLSANDNSIFVADVRSYSIAKEFDSWKLAYSYLRSV